MNFELGKVYEVTHSRKGTFTMRVERDDGEFIHGTMVSGTARAIMDYNVREAGDPICTRKDFITASKEV